jgi:2-(1,2-epoxy-1,2-dihydrophenyl)acetyl-CoA isomerase
MGAETGREDTLVRVEGQVAWITLNRPEVRNALLLEQRLYLIGLFERLSADRGVRAIVLTGNGDTFCSGADLSPAATSPESELGAPERIVGDLSRRVQHGAQRLIAAVLDCQKPVIAAVRGTVAGMAVQLALACDLVLAADDATFFEVSVARGLIPDAGAAYLLARLVGPQKAKQLFFFGDRVPANVALELGLVNAVVPALQLDETAQAWAARLATGPTRAIALTKWLVNRSMDTDRTGSFDDEAMAVELNARTSDAEEGIIAFLEHRPAAYLGW